jgi:branched-chain amino acid transport system substrate-binding protein
MVYEQACHMASRSTARMTTIVRALLCSALIISNWRLDARADIKSHSTAVKIGVIAATTGPLAWWGQGIAHAVELAGDDFDSTGSVTFVVEDDGFIPKNAVTAARKLIEQDGVAALIVFGGGSSTAVAEVCQMRRVPMIGISVVSGYTTERSLVYRIFMSYQEEIELIYRELERRHLNRVAVVSHQQESMLNYRNGLVARLGSKVVADEEIGLSDTDLQPLATRLQSKKPDAIVFFVNPPQLAPLTRALRNRRFEGPFFGGVNAFNPSEIEAAKGAMLGTIFTGPPREQAHQIIGQLKKLHKEEVSSEALYSYDAASLLIRAAQSGALHDFLGNVTSYKGALGTYRRNGQSFEISADLYKIEGSHAAVPIASSGDSEGG